MSRFLNSRLAALAPYAPGEQPQGRQFIKLNTNESPYPPAPGVAKAVYGEGALLHLYSDPTCRQVIEPLAAALDVQPNQVYVGNGSDEILAFLFAAFCDAGAAYADITYGFYPVYAQMWNLNALEIPLAEDFTLPIDALLNLNRTLFIANPNAPTGIAFSRAEIEQILTMNQSSLVVVDEAYIDFGAQTAVPLLKKYENLVVVGTFSKSRALAGGRLGYAVGRPSLIADLGRIKYSFNPYNVNRMTLAAGAAALEDVAYFEECRRKVMQTRLRTLQKLRAMGFEATESLANFVFVRHPAASGEELYHKLREEGILVRWFKKPRIDNHLRITIGTDAQMDALFAKMEKLL